MSADLIVVGLSHHTAPLDLRERLSVETARLADELQRVRDSEIIREVVLISTCNRVEVYVAAADAASAGRAARSYLESRADQELGSVLYQKVGEEAVSHAFRVASSLDSLVVGEPQILGQVKESYEAATAAGTIGSLLDRCFTRAFAVAKRVRSETGIAHGSVSVSSIACELAQKIFGDLRGRRCLLLGAGEMGEAAARSLAQTGSHLTVINRSPEKSEALATACGGEARGQEMLASELVTADVVISSTGSPRFVLTEELMRDVVRARRHRPLFLIDIAVPRDIDPRAGSMDGVFLYDVDDLQKVADENLASRRQHVAEAEAIVLGEVESFEAWHRTLELKPTIVALRAHVSSIVRGELERSLPRLDNLGKAERRALEKMVDATVNKLLHAPLAELKRSAGEPEGAALIAAARQLFQIDEREEARKSHEEKPEREPTFSLASPSHQKGKAQ